MSPRDKNLGARLPPAHFPQSHPQVAPTWLAAQLSLCSLSHSQGGGKILIPNRGLKRGKSPPCPPLSVFRELLLLPCDRMSPTIPISLLAAPACVSGLSYDYSLPTVSPKFLASDVHANLFCSHTVLQIKL